MSTILSDAANYYTIFFENGMLNEALVKDNIKGEDCIEERVKFIKKFYKILFDSSLLNKVSVLFIKTNMRYSKVAERFNIVYSEEILKGYMKPKSESNIKVDINYCNKKLENYLIFCTEDNVKKNYFNEIINDNELSKQILKSGMKSLDMLENKYFKNDKTKTQILVNLSNKEYCTEITDEEFSEFIKTVSCYFINQRKLNQQKVNKQNKAVGYYNYLMQSTFDDLSDEDKIRLQTLNDLMNTDIKKKEKKIYDAELSKLYEKIVDIEDNRIKDYEKKQSEQEQERDNNLTKLGKFFIKLYENGRITLNQSEENSINECITDIRLINELIESTQNNISIQEKLIAETEDKIEKRKEYLQNKKVEKLKKEVKEQITDEMVQQRIDEELGINDSETDYDENEVEW